LLPAHLNKRCFYNEQSRATFENMKTTVTDLILNLWSSAYAPYSLLIVVCVLLTALVFFSRLSETVVIEYGVYLIGGWLFVSFLQSLWVEMYWYYLLHWFLSSAIGFVYWLLAIYLCERLGSPYSGDGAMIMLLPFYLLPVAMLASVLLKGMLVLAGFLVQR
jgi:hypothetical protein